MTGLGAWYTSVHMNTSPSKNSGQTSGQNTGNTHLSFSHVALIAIVVLVCALLAYVFFVESTSAPTQEVADEMKTGEEMDDMMDDMEGIHEADTTQSSEASASANTTNESQPDGKTQQQMEAEIQQELGSIPPPPPPPPAL